MNVSAQAVALENRRRLFEVYTATCSHEIKELRQVTGGALVCLECEAPIVRRVLR
jgi:hypothetical protein